eukprot:522069_1
MSLALENNRPSVVRYTVVICCITLYGCCMWLRSSFSAITDALKETWPDTQQKDIATLASAFFTSYTLVQIPSGLLLQVFTSELGVIIPVFTSGLCSQLIYYSQSFKALIKIRILLGISCSTAWLGTLSLIQQYFSIYDVPFYAGIGLLIGQSGPIVGIYQSYLYQYYRDWRTPYFWIGILIQILCFILLIAYIIDRRSIIKPVSMTLQDDGEIQKQQKHLSVWKSWLLPRPAMINAYATKETYDVEIATNENAICSTSNNSLSKQIISAITNPYNYLFALIHSCCCIPQAILGAMWLKEYLEQKFQDSELHIDETTASTIQSCTNIGGGVAALIFGAIGKRYQTTNPYIYRTLIMFGFVLWSTTLFIIYIPAQYHYYWDLYLCALLSGSGMGAISIIFAGVRMANMKTNASDLACGLVSSLCMASIYASYEITGFIFSIM